MPIGASWANGSWVEDSWEDYSWGEVVAEYAWPLSAQETDTLLHAYAAMGKRNTLYILATLTDETGEVLTDQNGETLVAYGETPVTVLHVLATDTLLHAEQ